MQKYQIGRIEGPWRDFVPPIQYGVFRTREQQAEERSETERQQIEDGADSSENDTSEAPSPLFDPAERPESHLRKRRGSNGAASESSATSFSDLELEESPIQKEKAYGDDRTEQELKRDLELYPSLDQTTQADIISKYRQLDTRLRDAGLYECNYSAYFVESLRYTALGLTSYLLLQNGYYLLSAAFLGAMWHQLVFTVHDAGHMGITHNFHIDSCIGIFIANFLGGLSCCWWKRNHNVHHIVTNSAEHDPDIQHMPFFAISHRFFSSLKSTYYDRVMTYDPVAKFMLKYQHLMYYPLLTFGRFNLYVLSWTYIFGLQG
ncbi:fatty acid desaturase, partial [Hortaea werneckii]